MDSIARVSLRMPYTMPVEMELGIGGEPLPIGLGERILLGERAIQNLTLAPSRSFAREAGEQVAAQLAELPEYAWIAVAPVVVEAKEMAAGRMKLARMEAFIDSRVAKLGEPIGPSVDREGYQELVDASPVRRPCRAFKVTVEATHTSEVQCKLHGVVHGVVTKDRLELWPIGRGLVEHPSTREQVANRVWELFDRAFDIRFDGRTFLEDVKPPARMVADSQSSLDETIAYLIHDRAIDYGLRLPGGEKLARKDLNFEPLGFANAGGTHVLRFQVTEPGDRGRALTWGEAVISTAKVGDMVDVHLHRFAIEQGTLHRVSMESPIWCDGSSIGRAKRELIHQEMQSRGLIC